MENKSCMNCIYRKQNEEGKTITKNGVVVCTLGMRKERTKDEGCICCSETELGVKGLLEILQSNTVDLLEDYTGEKFSRFQRTAIGAVVSKYTKNNDK